MRSKADKMVGSLLLTQLESVCSSAQGMSLRTLTQWVWYERWQILINKIINAIQTFTIVHCSWLCRMESRFSRALPCLYFQKRMFFGILTWNIWSPTTEIGPVKEKINYFYQHRFLWLSSMANSLQLCVIIDSEWRCIYFWIFIAY